MPNTKKKTSKNEDPIFDQHRNWMYKISQELDLNYYGFMYSCFKQELESSLNVNIDSYQLRNGMIKFLTRYNNKKDQLLEYDYTNNHAYVNIEEESFLPNNFISIRHFCMK